MFDRKAREADVDKKYQKLNNLRQERFQRENVKWDRLETEEVKQAERIRVRADVYQAGKKNKGGSAYNIVNLDYDTNKDGDKLKRVDDDARVRAFMRSKNLDQKNNSGYNILTGDTRPTVQVPFHERYNPIKSAAGLVLGSQRSNT